MKAIITMKHGAAEEAAAIWKTMLAEQAGYYGCPWGVSRSGAGLSIAAPGGGWRRVATTGSDAECNTWEEPAPDMPTLWRWLTSGGTEMLVSVSADMCIVTFDGTRGAVRRLCRFLAPAWMDCEFSYEETQQPDATWWAAFGRASEWNIRWRRPEHFEEFPLRQNTYHCEFCGWEGPSSQEEEPEE